jgi:hypothetical protein
MDLLRRRESGPAPLATRCADFSLRSLTVRLEIVKICSRSPAMLATFTEVLQVHYPQRDQVVCNGGVIRHG